tara:strand:- start:269 stop:670 length:402 start_codon:yes stop_codon:yes gene_type:complete
VVGAFECRIVFRFTAHNVSSPHKASYYFHSLALQSELFCSASVDNDNALMYLRICIAFDASTKGHQMTEAELKKRIEELHRVCSTIYEEILEESGRGWKTDRAYVGILQHRLNIMEGILEGYEEQLAAKEATK